MAEEEYESFTGMMRNQQCPTEGCDGIDTFYRWVADTVECDLEYNTGPDGEPGDSDMLIEKAQGVFCYMCEEKVA